MKLQKITLLFFLTLISLTSCNSDDDDGGIDLLPQEEQNQVDDEAIVKFLQQHYFNTVGKIVRFNDESTLDDHETPLYAIAEHDESGYWIVKRPGVQATGRRINNTETDSILLQYELNAFTGKILEDSIYYTTPRNVSNTINASGYPIWDPAFYYKDVSNIEDAQKSWYEIEGIQEGLKHFNSSDKAITDLPAVDFQGLIIVPSRLAFERDYNLFSIQKDETIYLNFQLYQVVDRQ